MLAIPYDLMIYPCVISLKLFNIYFVRLKKSASGVNRCFLYQDSVVANDNIIFG